MNGKSTQTDEHAGRGPGTGNQGGAASATSASPAAGAAAAGSSTQTGGRTGGNPGPGAGGNRESGAAESGATQDELTALRREIDDLRDKNLRLLAEVQNAGKRAEREKQESLRYAEADFAKDLLQVLDDLERTLQAAQTAADPQALAQGVRMVHDHFLKVLRARHIVPIDAAGQPFDPAHHEALLQQPSEEHPAGTVMQEVARGYKMHERVLRPTRAIVSSGPGPGAQNAGAAKAGQTAEGDQPRSSGPNAPAGKKHGRWSRASRDGDSGNSKE